MPLNLDEKTIQSLISGKSKEEIIGENGILKELTKTLVEAALKAELDTHLGYKKYDKFSKNSDNARNGYSSKTISSEFGETEIEIPRDRNGSFEPQLIPKGKTRFDSFDRKILALYARGMTTRDIQSNLKEIYGVEVSPTLISNVTDIVIDEVKTWQNRPLEKTYPIVYFDGLVVKVNENRKIINKVVYLALGVNIHGHKELLGFWIAQTEGAKFWLSILTELQNRGLKNILISCVDGLTGFPDAINTVYPNTKVQLCIVHKIRNSLKYVSWKNKKELASDLKNIYNSTTSEEGLRQLELFGEKWDKTYPSIAASWLKDWDNLSVLFEYPAEIRKVIYTTNMIESLNMSLRKVTKNRRVFPNDEAVFKCLYLAISKIQEKWTMPIRNWLCAANRFMIEFPEAMEN